MRTIKTLFLGFLAASMICGCSSVSVSSNVSYEEQSWNEFIGKHNGQIGMVVAAPEVNDSGENVSSQVKVSKPETKKPRNTVMPSAEVPFDASAEVCLEKWLRSFQKNDWTQVICLSTGLYLNEKPDNKEGAISYVLSEIEWKIKESTVVNDNAKFTVEVTVPDTLEALKEYIEAENKRQINVDKDYENKIKNDVENIVSKAERKTQTFEIEMTKCETLWKVNLTDDILNAMTGGLSDFYRELRQDYLKEATSR